ncbi:MAG: phosphate ABC transporter permease subunit PstC [Alphaproteobacteria bacterium]|nr:phosphate ABC transporter permease subunit PstC [Alphaproteobacteria bacterium]
MNLGLIAGVILALALFSYHVGRGRALRTAGGHIRDLHSLPSYYGAYVAVWCGLPSLLILAVWAALGTTIVEAMVVGGLPDDVLALPPDQLNLIVNDIRNLANGNLTAGSADDPVVQAGAARYAELRSLGLLATAGATAAVALLGLSYGLKRVQPRLRARNVVEVFIKVVLIVSSTIAVFTTIGIVLSLLFEAIRFFQKVPVHEFLFGLEWSPQTAIRADQVGSSGAFGAIPVFAGTLLITLIAMCVSVPVGLFSAIYLSEYADHRIRAAVKPIMEVLAGIPTVVYGFFAALMVAPTIRGFGEFLGLDVASESALAAGLVMGIMIIPFVSSLSDDVISAVPQSLREGSLGIGATKSETIKQVILPAALPGIVGAILLAVSRAIGETMIVVMAAGLAANLTANPFEAVTTVTVQIVTLLVGDQEFDSAKTLAAFALGLVLFAITLMLNVVALRVVQKYREKYD